MNPTVTALSVLLTPVLAEGLKLLLKIDPEAKGKMKLVALALTSIAAVLNAASGDNVPGLTEMLLTGGAMFLAQDGLYNTMFKPMFGKIKDAMKDKN